MTPGPGANRRGRPPRHPRLAGHSRRGQHVRVRKHPGPHRSRNRRTARGRRAVGPLTAAELGRTCGLDVSTLRRHTTTALKAGLVAYTLDPSSALARKITLTDEGKRRLGTERTANLRELAEILTGWPTPARATRADHLQRLSTETEHLHGHPWPRP